MKLSARELFSSRIDYPQEELPADLWNKDGDQYTLKPEIAEAIINMSSAVLIPHFKGIEDWLVTYVLGSSIATQFWKGESDLDVKVVIDPEQFKAANPQYADANHMQLKDIFLEVFDAQKGKEYFKIGNRPMDMFLTIDEDLYTEDYQKRYDALYDVNSQRWIKNPTLYDVDTYDRNEVVTEGEEMALEWATKWDLDLGTIQRKVKEAQQIQEYIQSLTPKRAKIFKQKIENLLDELEKSIEKMHSEKEYVKEEYYDAYDKYDGELSKYYDSVNAQPEVIRIKLLNLWGYLYIIKNLNKFIKDDGEISPSEIDTLNDTLKDRVP
jgi:hypothetical protein